MCSFRGSHVSQQLSPSLPEPPAAVLAQIADALPWPLLLLRRDTVLLHANLAARQVLQRGQPLQMDTSLHVLPAAPAQQAAFAAALNAAEPALLHWPAAQQWPLGGGCSVTLTPMRAAGSASESALAGGPMLVMLGSVASRHADLQAFAQLHRLTAAESRVLERLGLGHSCTETAAGLGTKAATVRSQLSRLRRKTGHASMAALLRTLAALPPLALLAPLHLVQPPRDELGE